jgi:hypothetical protein
MHITQKQAKRLAITLYRNIIPGLKSLPQGKPMTTEQICGAAFWYALDPLEQVFVDQFILKGAQRDVFNLTPCGPDSAGNQLFCRP